VEISLFQTLQTFLQHYLFKTDNDVSIVQWQQLVDALISDYAQRKYILTSAFTQQDKRSLVLSVQQKGLFKYQDAANYLAAKLNVSRATIYNYLKQANQFKLLQVHQVDAFTDEPFSGNPAGVVLEADELDESMMKKITREMNLSETSFQLNSKKADIKLRYFTPTGAEVKFCGHSTVAALYMLAHNKMLDMKQAGHYKLSIETKVGVIKAAVVVNSDERITIQFQTPKVELVTSQITHEKIANALGIAIEAIERQQPIMFEKTNQDLFITVSNLKQLKKLQIDSKSAKQFAEAHNIVAYVALCNETISRNSHIHMRCFAPAVGIIEDPFTGSVLGGLASYVIQQKLVKKNIRKIRVEQGHFIQRPGYVDLKLSGSLDEAPLVIAKARHFFSTAIKL